MKALFLAGGMGTRLRPLTDHLPKPMVPLMNRPMLERNMITLRHYGIKDIILSTCYKADYIQRYFGNGEKFGLSITYVKEDVPLGTGGAIKNAASCVDGSFLIFNADILCDMNFADLIRFHRSKEAAVTIAVTTVKNPSAYGVIEYNDNRYATSFKEKPKASEIRSHFINAGIYVFEPWVLKEIMSDRPVSVEREVFPHLLEKGYRIAVYDGCSYWMDIGTPEKYLRAHRDVFMGKYIISDVQRANGNIAPVKLPEMDSTVHITQPVYIGDHVKIDPHAVIGPYAVIGDNTSIHTGAHVSHSVLWSHVVVGKGAVVSQTAVPAGEVVPENSENVPLKSFKSKAGEAHLSR
ncbi:MAG: NDP-sugar synthase [Ethanoligenens sp.]